MQLNCEKQECFTYYFAEELVHSGGVFVSIPPQVL